MKYSISTQHTPSPARGFTLVELMLAMAFVAVLLLAIAMLVLQIGSIFNKGVTLQAVNQAGQVISSDMQATLDATKSSEVKSVIQASGGRICAGTVVYAWNTADNYDKPTSFNVRADGSRAIRFVKFPISSTVGATNYCAVQSNGSYPVVPNTATELLSGGDTDLLIHKLSFSQSTVAGDASQTMYVTTMRIGTREADVIGDNGCSQPASKVDDEYCAVNTLQFYTRSGKGSE